MTSAYERDRRATQQWVDRDLLASFQFVGSAGSDKLDIDYAGVCQQYSCYSLDMYTWDLYEPSAWKIPYTLHSCTKAQGTYLNSTKIGTVHNTFSWYGPAIDKVQFFNKSLTMHR